MRELENKLRSLDLFAGFSDAELRTLALGTSWVQVKIGDTIFASGDAVDKMYLISYGGVKLVRNANLKNEAVMCFLSRGHVVAAPLMNKEAPKYPVSAIALEDTGLIAVDRVSYRTHWLSHSVLKQRIESQVFDRLHDFQTDKAMVMATVQERVADFLIRTLEGQPHIYGNKIIVRLTRQDVADRIGATIESVIRVLSDWTKKGYVATYDHHIEVIQKNELELIVKSELKKK